MASEYHEPHPTNGGAPVGPTILHAARDTALLPYIVAAREYGLKKYGVELHTRNGRDALRDFGQELADAAQYLAQLILEGGDIEQANALIDAFIVTVYRLKHG